MYSINLKLNPWSRQPAITIYRSKRFQVRRQKFMASLSTASEYDKLDKDGRTCRTLSGWLKVLHPHDSLTKPGISTTPECHQSQSRCIMYPLQLKGIPRRLATTPQRPDTWGGESILARAKFMSTIKKQKMNSSER
jgi:hypothetical protein